MTKRRKSTLGSGEDPKLSGVLGLRGHWRAMENPVKERSQLIDKILE